MTGNLFHAKELCGVLISLVQSPQSSIAKDKIQLKQYARYPPARYSEAISNSETNSLDDWIFSMLRNPVESSEP